MSRNVALFASGREIKQKSEVKTTEVAASREADVDAPGGETMTRKMQYRVSHHKQREPYAGRKPTV